MIDIGHVPEGIPVRIIIGASAQSYPGWIATQEENLNLLNREDWELSFQHRKIDCIVAEHVWEHLTEKEGVRAACLCFEFLNPGGYVRCAVPDGYFPDANYQKLIQKGFPRPHTHPQAQHKMVYNYRSLTAVFESAGFTVELLEYCDAHGHFHFRDWNPADGFIYRSKRFDHRNKNGRLNMVSLIIDAKKPV